MNNQVLSPKILFSKVYEHVCFLPKGKFLNLKLGLNPTIKGSKRFPKPS